MRSNKKKRFIIKKYLELNTFNQFWIYETYLQQEPAEENQKLIILAIANGFSLPVYIFLSVTNKQTNEVLIKNS